MLTNKQAIVVNLFGEPCAGKSTVSAMLFSLLKLKHYNVELVQEYAKDLVYEQRTETLKDQLYLLGKQNHRLQRTVSQVDVVINDSPLVLSSLYSVPDYFPSFNQFVLEVFNSYNNINFFALRPETRPYQQSGRYQDEQGALDVRQRLIHYMEDNHIEYIKIESNESAAERIYKHLHSVKLLPEKP